jgi:hypothetical protein
VSPIKYRSFDCDQIEEELARVSQKVTQLTGRLDQAATNDAILMGVALVVFWPAAFALGGTKGQEMELSNLKGDNEALLAAANTKKCSRVLDAVAAAEAASKQKLSEDKLKK